MISVCLPSLFVKFYQLPFLLCVYFVKRLSYVHKSKDLKVILEYQVQKNIIKVINTNYINIFLVHFFSFFFILSSPIPSTPRGIQFLYCNNHRPTISICLNPQYTFINFEETCLMSLHISENTRNLL